MIEESNLPSRPIGEFNLRKCDSVDAYVKRFNTYGYHVVCVREQILNNPYLLEEH